MRINLFEINKPIKNLGNLIIPLSIANDIMNRINSNVIYGGFEKHLKFENEDKVNEVSIIDAENILYRCKNSEINNNIFTLDFDFFDLSNPKTFLAKIISENQDILNEKYYYNISGWFVEDNLLVSNAYITHINIAERNWKRHGNNKIIIQLKSFLPENF